VPEVGRSARHGRLRAQRLAVDDPHVGPDRARDRAIGEHERQISRHAPRTMPSARSVPTAMTHAESASATRASR
jgi:hypothetical protein